jgi:nitrile hydratase subunit beta
MDGVHDLGGMQGFGAVGVDEPDVPFHHDWEGRMWAIARTCRAPDWTIDWWRHMRERIDPTDYLSRPFFDQWMQTYAAGFVTSGIFTVDEIASGHTAQSAPAPAALSLDQIIENARDEAHAFDAPADADALYAPGDLVRGVSHGAAHHSRLPRYVRGRTGVIRAHWGAHVFADLSAKGIKVGQHIYSVEFSATELWGPDADARDQVHLDLWESYLEPA